MADQGPMLRVKDANGNLFNMSKADADKFRAANPGASVVGNRERAADDEVVAMPDEDDEQGDSEKYGAMKKPELVSLASTRGISLEGNKTKAEIIELLEADDAKE